MFIVNYSGETNSDCFENQPLKAIKKQSLITV